MEVSVGPPTVTIHFDDEVAVCETSAEMSSTKEQGYFASDTRLISGHRLKLCGKPPVLCNSAAVRHHSARFEFTNPAMIAADGEPLEEHVLHLRLDRTIGHGVHEDYDLTSFARRPVVVELEVSIESDFVDLFDVKTIAASTVDGSRAPGTDRPAVLRGGSLAGVSGFKSGSLGRTGRSPVRPRRRHRGDRPGRAAGPAVIQHPAYPVEPWCLRETELHLDVLAQSESLFALSNGHIGWRGNLDEGEPHGLPGSYLNGVYESRPLSYAEAGYGHPEDGQTVINVTNAKLIRLLVDDQPFDVRYGALRAHERSLDFRAGLLERRVEWVSPGGRAVRVRSTRLVSLVQRSVAAISYEVEPLDAAVRVVVQSELVANEALPPARRRPPAIGLARAAAALGVPRKA